MPTLDWIGKKAVLNHHREVPYHLLRCNEELSVGTPDSGNLIIEGDNLVALKALLPYYAGQVKCIYIDPPYNTGNENWVYNDAVNSPEMRNWLGKVVGGEAEDLSRHDKWLCMMYPRLTLLRQFLREDGVIFISIDDNELANLLILANEILGPQNNLATLVWEKGRKGDSKYFSETHEYIVVYARNKRWMTQNNIRWKKPKNGIDKVLAHYQNLRDIFGNEHDKIRAGMMKWYRSLSKNDPAKGHKHYNRSDDRGLYFAADFAGPDDGRENRPRYDIIHPISHKPCKKPSTGWRWDEETTRLALLEDPPRIHFGLDENTIPCRKTYLFEANQEPFATVFYKDGRAATLSVEEILGKGVFAFPKDADIISDIIAMVTNPNDLILDSFAGSGTTGHAVLKLNQATPDQNPRRFILIEMESIVARDVTAERLRRVARGYTNAKGNYIEGLGGGFRYCTLSLPLFNEAGAISKEVEFTDLAAHVFFTETGQPLQDPESAGFSPLLGLHEGIAVYLLFNGILGDKTVNGGNVLTAPVLASLPPHDGPKIIYGEGNRLGIERMRREGITFKQIPYRIRLS